MGGKCSVKNEYPGAILCHSDYYMDNDEMARTVIGPSFIINHRFDSAGGTLTEGEATYTVVNGKVGMVTRGGGMFTHHYN
jgi:hypothetical protein